MKISKADDNVDADITSKSPHPDANIDADITSKAPPPDANVDAEITSKAPHPPFELGSEWTVLQYQTHVTPNMPKITFASNLMHTNC